MQVPIGHTIVDGRSFLRIGEKSCWGRFTGAPATYAARRVLDKGRMPSLKHRRATYLPSAAVQPV